MSKPGNNTASVLIVDDKDIMRESLDDVVRRAGHRTRTARSGSEALELFGSGRFDLVVTDLKMPRMDGIELTRRIREIDEDCPVVVITAYATIETAVDAMKQGAFDYLQKPFKIDEIEVVLEKALAHRRLVEENRRLRAELDDLGGQRQLVGQSGPMKQLEGLIERVAATDSTVLIQGETGTGKELIARAIHYGGPRRSGPLLTVNCAALSAGLLESELFGHRKGAFTGADRDREGRFELADGGTILLDEVSEIDQGLQAKLLRVLQESEFEPVGSSASIRVDVRVIATTNRDMAEAVREGAFREDLFFRLNVVPVVAAPLRDRREDIPLLVEHFCQVQARRMGVQAKAVDPAAMQALAEYRWPGNVRELENLVERLYVLAPGATISAADVAPYVGGGALNVEDVRSGEIEPGYTSIEQAERILIEATLERFDGHRQKTADALGIGVRTLGMKLKEWGMLKK